MKRALKYIFYCIGIVVLVCILILGSIVGYYHSIVNAKVGKRIQTTSSPGDLGRWVNPFIGTGGFPWVCGHNFPGATLSFGMVRLSPETTSILINKKAQNTSGYYYGDNKIIGFSHTKTG